MSALELVFAQDSDQAAHLGERLTTGLLDLPESCDALLAWAGYADGGAPDIAVRRETDLDRLADAVEKYLDTARLAALLAPEPFPGRTFFPDMEKS